MHFNNNAAYQTYLENSSSSSCSSLSNVIFENAGNDFNNESNVDTSEAESCFSSKSERDKTKRDLCYDQQTRILANIWKEYQDL